MFDLTGKKALVTGSTQGIGEAVARCFADHGARVFIHGATSVEKCKRVSDDIGEAATPVVTDLGDIDCAEQLYAQTGDVDILVLNASVQYRNPWNTITPEEFQKQIDVNLRASLMLVQKYAPAMLEKGCGRIVFVGSVQQYKPHKDMAVYAATKEAQISLMKNLASQFAGRGVTVNGLAPGVIATPRNDVALADPAYAKVVYSKIPAGYAGEPGDCAGAALLLCSEAGRYITGVDLIVDGGMHL